VAVDQDKGGGEESDHREERHEDGDARHQAELANALERGQQEHQERARRGKRAQQDAGSRAEGGALERGRHRCAELALLVIAEEEVDAVVDADPDHDRDEHHREDAQVSDGQRDHPHGPGQAHRQRRDHQDGRDHPPEGHEQEDQGEGEGEERGELPVVQGGHHLVVGEGRRAGHARLDAWKLGAEPGDGRADGADPVPVLGEVSFLAALLDENEQEAAIPREEVAGVGIVEPPEREGRGPGRDEAAGSVEAVLHLAEHLLKEADVGRLLAAEAEVQESDDHRAGDLPVDGLEKLVQGGAGRVAFEELLVVIEAVAERGEIGKRDVEQRASVEVCRIDMVGDARTQAVLPELPGQAGRILPGILRARCLHRDHNVVQLAEVLEVFSEEDDVARVLRK
jgi:hypothetical protein